MLTLEPYIPTSGGSLGFLLAGIIIVLLVLPAIAKLFAGLLYLISEWAGITVLVFLRKNMGLGTVSAKRLLIGLLFLYLVGNMVGHNYHDVYRDKGATILGAQVHLTYMALYLGMGVFRAIQARFVRATVLEGELGPLSRLATLLPTHSEAAPRWGFYRYVVRDPLAVISVGLLLALVLHIWFGWYLIIVGCLLFYMLLYRARSSNSKAAGVGARGG